MYQKSSRAPQIPKNFRDKENNHVIPDIAGPQQCHNLKLYIESQTENYLDIICNALVPITLLPTQLIIDKLTYFEGNLKTL